MYRDSKQTDKAVFDLATRSFSPGVPDFLMSLLNEDNKWVKETHESHHEMELLQAKCCLPSKDPTDLSAKFFAHFESEEGKISTQPINAQVSAVTITDKEPVDDTLVRSKAQTRGTYQAWR